MLRIRYGLWAPGPGVYLSYYPKQLSGLRLYYFFWQCRSIWVQWPRRGCGSWAGASDVILLDVINAKQESGEGRCMYGMDRIGERITSYETPPR